VCFTDRVLAGRPRLRLISIWGTETENVDLAACRARGVAVTNTPRCERPRGRRAHNGHGTGHGTGMDPEEESPWIGPRNRARLVAGMVFTLKATITVPGVGGLRTERIVHLAETGADPLDAFPMRLHW
jgi:Metallopeptidase family M24/D-isomer specific 2-hydroxyacid dehydrogenase, catalytic domain